MTSQYDSRSHRDLHQQLTDYEATAAATQASANWKDRLQYWPIYAAAAGSSLALASSASASIIYSGTQNVVINLTNVSQTKTAQINIDGLGPAEMALFLRNNFATFRQRAALDTAGAGNAGQFLLNGSLQVKRLASGDLISAGGPFAGGNRALVEMQTFPTQTVLAGTWPFPTTAFAGIRFAQAGQPHFGWIRLKLERVNGVGSTGPDRLTAIDWAYNDVVNGSILAGDIGGTVDPIPEPASLTIMSVLAAGSAGVLAWRRRRAANAPAV